MKETFFLNQTDMPKICFDNLTGDRYGPQSVRYEETSTIVRVLLGIIITLTTVVSILGNLFTCLIVYRKSSMRSAINLLLTNMAIADLSLATIVMPFVLCGLIRSKINYHVAVCMCFSILKDVFIGVTFYTMLVVSMDRYMIIVHRKDGVCPKFAKKTIVVIWICSITIALLQLLDLRDQSIYYYSIFCGHDMCKVQTLNVVYTNVLVSVMFFIPVLAMLYFYAVVLRTVQKCSSKIHNHPMRSVCVSVTQYSCKLGLPTRAIPVRFTGDFNAKRRAFGTILLMFVTIVVCWLPYMVNRVILVTYRSKSYDVTLTNILLCVGFFKSTLYPITYYYRNRKFRAACKHIFPPLEKLSVKFYTLKQRRVNPRSLYECPSADTRI